MHWRFNSLLLVGPLTLLLASPSAQAALILTDLSGFIEDFDFLAHTGVITWVNNQATRNTAGSPGWYWQRTGDIFTYTANNGASGTGALYSYGTNDSSDRAMGTLNSGTNANAAWGLVMQNNSGIDINNVAIQYTGEQWRRGANAAGQNVLRFSYQVSASNITTMAPASGAVPTGWTAVTELDFASLHGGGATALDGNNAVNQALISHLISVNVPVGHYLAIRWYSADAPSTDAGLAIDNLSVSFNMTAVPEPSGIGLAGIALLTCWRASRRRHQSVAAESVVDSAV